MAGSNPSICDTRDNPGLTTLWVDDEPPEVSALRDMLNGRGLSVQIVPTSAEAKAEVLKGDVKSQSQRSRELRISRGVR